MATEEVKLLDLTECSTDELVSEYVEFLDENKVPEEKRAFIAHMIELQKNELNSKYQFLGERATTGNVATYDKLLIPMITRGYMNVAAQEIFGVWPMTADSGKFFYMSNHYTGSAADEVAVGSGKILIVADSSAFAVNDSIASTGDAATGTIKYKETHDHALFVEVATGTFAVGDSIDDAASYVGEETTITRILPADLAMHVFTELSKFDSMALGEAAGTGIKEVELKIDSETVDAENHKIKSRYTWELLRRLTEYHKLNGEKIIDGIGAQAFAQEINRRSFVKVKTAATSGGATAWNYDAQDGRWELERYKNLIATINRRSADILMANHIGLGNYIVIDPITWAALDTFGYIDTSMLPGKFADPMVQPFVGVLLGRYKVYVNPWEWSNTINMGMKDFGGTPDAETKAGIFYCPYIPIDIKQTMEQETGQPVKFFWSSYAFKDHPMYNTSGTNDFFRRISISNLPT